MLPPDPAPPAGPKPEPARAVRNGVLLLVLGLVCCFVYFPVGLIGGLFLIMLGGVKIFSRR